MKNSKMAALAELGILCLGKSVNAGEGMGDGKVDPGPHVYSGHPQLCRFEFERHQHPFQDKSISTYSRYPDDLSLKDALARTRLVILLGMADSKEMEACLASAETVVVLFEPDEEVLAEFLNTVKLARLNRKNLFCFTGDPLSFDPALQDVLPKAMFRVGTPAFFMTDRIREQYRAWAHQVIEYFEILHYRYAIYPFAGQALTRSYPVREIYRGILYDQQLHAYENISAFMTSSNIEPLRGVMKGVPALLVAAGPELSDKLDYLRANRDKALIICVNNAVKSLTDAGIAPHMVVINDTSVHSGVIFDHIPELPDTVLVAHCLSALGGDTFRRRYLFGSFLPEVFGEREMLRLHGSVISTAFSLAFHLGCSKSILVGAQLASHNPWGLNYSKGAVDKKIWVQSQPELIGRYPQLYPVTTPQGEQVYTTTNFRDASLWLAEVIRLSGMECINTSKSSILFGPGIKYDPSPVLEGGPVNERMADVHCAPPPAVDRQGVIRYLRHELDIWTSVHAVAETMVAEEGPNFLAKGMAILDRLDRSNVTYLIERYSDFDSSEFYSMVFEGDDASRSKGLRYYYSYVHRMSQEFLELLKKAARSL